MPQSWSRRHATLGLAGALGLQACAAARGAGAMLVNLAEVAPLPSPSPDVNEALLAAEADVARRMTVPVRLNGRGPFEFVVDTGANHSVLAAELAEPLGLPAGAAAAVHGIAGVEQAATVVINRLAVGAVTSRRVRMPLLAEARLGAQGLLGVDVLRNRRVTLDFKANQLRIQPSDAGNLPRVTVGSAARMRGDAKETQALPDASVVVVPARQRFGQLIIIDADVGGHPVTAFLDSGSQNTVGNLALRDAILGAGPERAVQTLQVRLISATGQTAAGELAALPPLRVGGLRMGGLSAVFADLHVFDIWDLKAQPAILIGVDVMRHFQSIELDFGRKLVTFRTPPSSLRRAPTPGG